MDLLRTLRGLTAATLSSAVRCGPVRLDALLAVREERLDLVGFALLLTNEGPEAARIDTTSFAARAGGLLVRQALADSPSVLRPGETLPAWFVIQGDGRGRPGRLAPDNLWTLTVEVLPPGVSGQLEDPP
jgi:hypothetical protein